MKKLKTILQSNIFYLILIFISLNFSLIYSNIPFKSSLSGNENELRGIIKEISFLENKISIKLKINSNENIQATYFPKNEEELKVLKQNLGLGKTISLLGTLSEPNNNTIPNNFNYKKYLIRQKIYYLFFIDNIKIEKNENKFYKIKNLIIRRAEKNNSYPYIKAFILGNSSNISKETLKSYRINGISHLFAISGMHIGIFIITIEKVINKSKTLKKYQIITYILFLFLYGFIIGYTPSFMRAALFFLYNKIYKISNIKVKSINIFILTISTLLLINSNLLYNIGFQYSVMTSLGLIIAKEYINNNNYIINILKVSSIAFLFSFPITLFYYYEINLCSILNNVIFVPIITILLFPLSIITFIFPIFDIILVNIIKIIEFINIFLSENFVLNINIPINLYSMIFIYLFIFLGLKKSKKYFIGLITILLIIKFFPKLNNSCYIYSFDVGQGDCNLIIFPYQKETILIDTGGKIKYQKENQSEKNNYSISDNIITFLKSKGIKKINKLIITHGDYDHMGEATNLINNFKVENVIFNNDEFNELENELIKVLDMKKIKYYKRLKDLNVSKNKLYFLNTKEYNNENDNSNVLYFKINKYKFLFMGDAGVNREKDILDRYNLTNIDFIKIGHHGSNTSSSKEFINSIKPKNCLISVGKNNRYGHPKKSVIDILDDYCNIYRTDLNGSIEIKLNKNNYKIKTYSP